MRFDMGEDFWITSDSQQWMLKKYKGIDKNGQTMFAPIGYYVEFENVVKALYEYRLRTDEAKDFQEAMRRSNEILTEIANRLEPDYKLTLQATPERGVITTGSFARALFPGVNAVWARSLKSNT